MWNYLVRIKESIFSKKYWLKYFLPVTKKSGPTHEYPYTKTYFSKKPAKLRSDCTSTQQTRNVIVTFSIGFKLVTLNLTFGKRLANVYVLCRHIFDV